MNITVKLFATLRKYIDAQHQGTCKMEIPDNVTIADVLIRLGIPDEVPKILLINNTQQNLEKTLSDGDVLSVFPPIAGG